MLPIPTFDTGSGYLYLVYAVKLSKTATFWTVLDGLEVLALQRRQVAALYSDHYRQVPLYIKCLNQGRLAALDRWLHYTVTTIDRFHCTSNVWTRGGWLL